MNELQLICDSYQVDIAMITEVKAKNTLEDPEELQFGLTGYTSFSNLQDENSHRGAIVYVSESVNTSITVHKWSHSPEGVQLTLSLHENDKMELCCVYRSPSSRNVTEHSVHSLIDHLVALNSSHLLIAGDFNSPNINWTDWTASDADGQMLMDTVQNNFLYQHIDKPTRYRIGTRPTCIDLVLTNEEGMVNNLVSLPGIGLSDHICLLFDYQAYTQVESNNLKSKYHIGNYEAMKRELQTTQWTVEMAVMSTNEAEAFLAGKLKILSSSFIMSAYRD
jgi:hypothetical protein